MSDLVYQNYSNKCRGWINPSSLFFGPEITSLTSYQSPAGSNTVVSIIGNNFFTYSVIRFGTFTPTVFFINSTLLSFYVPNTLDPGTYTVQVCNGAICSNIVNYTIDMSSGYWMINAGGNTNTISNTNSNGVQVSWLSVGPPVYLENGTTPPTYDSNNPYKVPNNVTYIITGDDGGTNNFYIQLPTGINYIGRQITIQAQSGLNVLSTSTNIVALGSGTGTPQTIIVPGTDFFPSSRTCWSSLVNYDGTLWIVMTSNWEFP